MNSFTGKLLRKTSSAEALDVMGVDVEATGVSAEVAGRAGASTFAMAKVYLTSPGPLC